LVSASRKSRKCNRWFRWPWRRMDENGDAIDRVARQMIDEHGENAVGILRDRAEMADHIGNELGAKSRPNIRASAKADPAIQREGQVIHQHIAE